jgi:hypothetical protein
MYFLGLKGPKPTTEGRKQSDRVTGHDKLTEHEYRTFQQAYSFFNAELFANSLPDLLVTLQRHAGAKGYFAPERFHGRVENEND